MESRTQNLKAKGAKRSRSTIILAFACSLARLHAQQLPSASADALLHRVDDLYNHTGSLRTRYTEQYTGLGLSRTESGTLLLKKPGRMLWRYDSPVGKLFVFDGKYAWFYTPGDREAQRIPAAQLDALHTPLRFLLGHTQLKKELDGVTVTQQADYLVVAGVPHGMAARIRLLTLNVLPIGTITGMHLEEVDGATTTFTFTDIEPGAPATTSDFTFTPPPGVTVIDSNAPI